MKAACTPITTQEINRLKRLVLYINYLMFNNTL